MRSRLRACDGSAGTTGGQRRFNGEIDAGSFLSTYGNKPPVLGLTCR